MPDTFTVLCIDMWTFQKYREQTSQLLFYLVLKLYLWDILYVKLIMLANICTLSDKAIVFVIMPLYWPTLICLES